MAAGRRMSMERKYDGEYCQIHIDISKKNDGWLKIFSKSGRDSTGDRTRVHEYVSPNKTQDLHTRHGISLDESFN